MQGKRVYLEPGDCHLLKPGEYTLNYAVPPECNLIANLNHHKVIEHEDGTITVSPSILVSNSVTEWHGFLERGVWRKC